MTRKRIKMCQSSRGYISESLKTRIYRRDIKSHQYAIERDCEGIRVHLCLCGGSHSKNGKCLRCGKMHPKYEENVRHWV